MANYGSCPYASRKTSDNSIHCDVLRKKGDKWGFCIHQYFCRTIGKYAMSTDADSCKVKAQKTGGN